MSGKASTGIAWFSTPQSRTAHGPLLSDTVVDAVQWTVDSLRWRAIPAEDQGVLDMFSARAGLSGHGVHYPLLSVAGDDVRNAWISGLRQDPYLGRYRNFSVHFGFSAGWKLSDGAPLPVPLDDESLQTGIRNLGLLAKTVPCRVGLENLALAFSMQDVQSQGKFIEKLLDPFDGFLLLDLHNLYCQSVNFGVGLMTLAKSYPLHRVREIHVSGGSWAMGGKGRKIRRDTHDAAVPPDLMGSLEAIASLCPDLDFVFLEQLPAALRSESMQAGMRDDYYRMRRVLGHV